MNKNLRWKLLTIVTVFVVFFAVGVYPILAQRFHLPAPNWLMAKELRLGLDLKGGVHLVLRVQTDDALVTHTTTIGEQLREELRTAGITPSTLRASSPTILQVEGVPAERDAEFRRIADEQLGGQYRPQLRRRRRLHLHDEAERREGHARADRRPGGTDD